jgi:hypothetical protein
LRGRALEKLRSACEREEELDPRNPRLRKPTSSCFP